MNSNLNKVIVVSSFSQDNILYEDSGVIVTREGGPAYWIAKTLKDLEVYSEVLCGVKSAYVDIKIGKSGEERGEVVSVEEILVNSKRKASAFIISTVAEEFLLENIVKFDGLIALDAQGYAREAKKKNEKFRILKPIAEKVDILKASKEEESYIDRKLLATQRKEKILIITEGRKGFTVFIRGERFVIPAKLVDAKNAIGAGDTLLAVFVAQQIKGMGIKNALQFACDYVEEFIARKQHFEYEK